MISAQGGVPAAEDGGWSNFWVYRLREIKPKLQVSQCLRLVAEAYDSGETIQGLMERYRVTQGTILGHLTRYLSAGNTLRKGEDLQELTSVAPEQKQAILAAFDELSPTFLKPVYEKLNGELNYDELKILRMLYLISRQE